MLAWAGRIVALCLACAPACAQVTEAEFFRGKTIQMHVGFGPGGNNDQWARVVARFIGRHVPGNPAVVIQNTPGAGGLKALNYLYNVAPRDGTVWAVVARGLPLEPLMGGQGVEFDPLKLTYVGSPARDTTVCAVTRETPVKTIDDFLRREVVVGSTGSGAETHVMPLLLSNVLGMKFRIVAGYKGSTDILLAMERREVDGMCIAFESLERRAAYRDGQFRAAFQASLDKDPALPDTPHVFDLKMSADQRKVLELIFVRDTIGRPFIAPPGLPPARAKTIQDAFAAAMRDPELAAEAKAQGLTLTPVDGPALTGVIAEAYRAPPEIARQAAAALGR